MKEASLRELMADKGGFHMTWITWMNFMGIQRQHRGLTALDPQAFGSSRIE